MPEYSVAEARVNTGRYTEAIEEYRKVIGKHPDDMYPHLRIADIALKHLQDATTAEAELLAAFAKANGEDSAALAPAGWRISINLRCTIPAAPWRR